MSTIWRFSGVGAIALLAVALVFAARPAAHGLGTSVTWAADIEPLVQRRCAGCHAPGGVADLPITGFAQAARLAQKTKTAVLARTMPPWKAAPGFGDFANDASLTPYERDLFLAWADSGAPRGNEAGVGRLAARKASSDPVPDLVLEPGAPRPVRLRRQRYRFATRLKEDRWIRGWSFRPGNHALVKQARIFTPDSTLGVWVPPESAVLFPEGIGQRLARGTVITVEIDYRRPVEAATDRSSLALFFADGPVEELRHLRVRAGTLALAENVRALELRPRLGSSGESVRAVARRPDGSSEPLLWIRDYDRDHQATYRFRRPVDLPRGTRIDVFSFDPDCVLELAYVRR